MSDRRPVFSAWLQFTLTALGSVAITLVIVVLSFSHVQHVSQTNQERTEDHEERIRALEIDFATRLTRIEGKVDRVVEALAK